MIGLSRQDIKKIIVDFITDRGGGVSAERYGWWPVALYHVEESRAAAGVRNRQPSAILVGRRWICGGRDTLASLQMAQLPHVCNDGRVNSHR